MNDNNINKDSRAEDDIANISQDDLESLRLLQMQLKAILIDIYSEVTLWNSTIDGMEYILQKYDHKNNIREVTPDILALQSSYGFFIARSIFMNIAFTRYKIVSKRFREGTFEYSLQPNLDINTANIFGTIANLFFIKGAQGIVNRDNNQPVFGL